MTEEDIPGFRGRMEALYNRGVVEGVMRSQAPGTPAARFVWLMNELEQRFPNPEPFSSKAPETHYLSAIDALKEKAND